MEELKQAENRCGIEGILSEIDLKEGVSKKTQKPYIMGEVKVRVNTLINNEPAELEIPVRVFANQFDKNGKTSSQYMSIKKLEEMVSIASCGNVEMADRVCFDERYTTIQMNEYYNRSEQLTSYPIIRGSFCKKVPIENCRPDAAFTHTVVIGGMKDETDRNGDLTGRLVIKGILPQWGNKVDVIEYVVENESAINHIRTYWHKGDTVRLAGIVNFCSKVEDEIIEMGFGPAEVKHHTKFCHELLVTKGSAGSLDENNSYSKEEITAALARREAYLADLKAQSQSKKVENTANSESDFGF